MVSNNTSFHAYGVALHCADGDVILNAGANMTIQPAGNLVVFSAQIPDNVSSINGATGDVTLVAGPGITIDTAGSVITIFAGDGYVSENGLSAYVTEDASNYYITES